MSGVLHVKSGAVVDARTGAALGVTSGSVIDVCGNAWMNQETDPEEPPVCLDPPVFGNIAYVAGPSVIILSCDTDRGSVVRFKARAVVGGVPGGPFVYSAWETIPITTCHVRQISGLMYSTIYRVQIEINGLVDPDLAWALFDDGNAGPDFATADRGVRDPDIPEE